MARKLPIGVYKNVVKHIKQNSKFTVAAGALTSATVVHAVSVTNVTDNAIEVREGSTVKALILEYWVSSNLNAGQTSFVVCVEKVQNLAGGMTFTESQNLHTYANKRNVLYMTQGLANPLDGVAMPVLNQILLIPKGKQRMAQGDKIILSFAFTAGTGSVCGKTIFKEYY